jgi:hypothetical protein
MLCLGRTYVIKRRTIPNSGQGTFFNARYSCRIEPGSCITATKCGTIEFQIFKYIGSVVSIEAHIVLNQIITALNWEGAELQFNQSCRFKLTTNPLRKHYINS